MNIHFIQILLNLFFMCALAGFIYALLILISKNLKKWLLSK